MERGARLRSCTLVEPMSDKSAIEWTDATWNPVRGCQKISPGCKHCYAEVFAERWRGIPGHPYGQGFDLRLVPEKMREPERWRKPRRIFVNSMSDLFHDAVPLEFIQKVFAVMERCPWHQFQVLTKRPERAVEVAAELPWPSNVWVGTSVENALYTHRAETLRKVPAHVRFLSVEPLLGRIRRLPLEGIHWVIVGGESGPGARPIDPEWVTEIRDRCIRFGVAFFFKQWGGAQKCRTGRELDGRTWDQMPEDSHGTPVRPRGLAKAV